MGTTASQESTEMVFPRSEIVEDRVPIAVPVKRPKDITVKIGIQTFVLPFKRDPGFAAFQERFWKFVESQSQSVRFPPDVSDETAAIEIRDAQEVVQIEDLWQAVEKIYLNSASSLTCKNWIVIFWIYFLDFVNSSENDREWTKSNVCQWMAHIKDYNFLSITSVHHSKSAKKLKALVLPTLCWVDRYFTSATAYSESDMGNGAHAVYVEPHTFCHNPSCE